MDTRNFIHTILQIGDQQQQQELKRKRQMWLNLAGDWTWLEIELGWQGWAQAVHMRGIHCGKIPDSNDIRADHVSIIDFEWLLSKHYVTRFLFISCGDKNHWGVHHDPEERGLSTSNTPLLQHLRPLCQLLCRVLDLWSWILKVECDHLRDVTASSWRCVASLLFLWRSFLWSKPCQRVVCQCKFDLYYSEN